MLLQGINALPKGVALPVMSQEAIVLAFRKLFRGAWFSNFKFAMVEDLINGPHLVMDPWAHCLTIQPPHQQALCSRPSTPEHGQGRP